MRWLERLRRSARGTPAPRRTIDELMAPRPRPKPGRPAVFLRPEDMTDADWTVAFGEQLVQRQQRRRPVSRFGSPPDPASFPMNTTGGTTWL
jgi:hypothetical protein